VSLCFIVVFNLTKETRRRVWIGKGEIRAGGIGEGGREENILSSNRTHETFTFTVPPVVAVMNYMISV
jgi:hypothetical protein